MPESVGIVSALVVISVVSIAVSLTLTWTRIARWERRLRSNGRTLDRMSSGGPEVTMLIAAKRATTTRIAAVQAGRRENVKASGYWLRIGIGIVGVAGSVVPGLLLNATVRDPRPGAVVSLDAGMLILACGVIVTGVVVVVFTFLRRQADEKRANLWLSETTIEAEWLVAERLDSSNKRVTWKEFLNGQQVSN